VASVTICQILTASFRILPIIYLLQNTTSRTVLHNELIQRRAIAGNLVSLYVLRRVKVKVHFTPEQTTKDQRGSRGIALLFP